MKPWEYIAIGAALFMCVVIAAGFCYLAYMLGVYIASS